MSMRVSKALPLFFGFVLGVWPAKADQPAGVGVVLGVEGKNVVVKRILPDSPAAAQKALQVGDRILAVSQDKEPSVQIESLAQAVSLLRGREGTTVRLTIISPAEDASRARVVSFVRGELKALTRWGDGVLLTSGTKAPEIEMIELTSHKPERLSDHPGKLIVLEFWATWCGPCQQVMSELQTWSAKYPEWKDKVVLISVSVDDSHETARNHVQRKGWNRTRNVWVGPEAIKAYRVQAIPVTYVIGSDGRILAANPGDLPATVNQALKSR